MAYRGHSGAAFRELTVCLGSSDMYGYLQGDVNCAMNKAYTRCKVLTEVEVMNRIWEMECQRHYSRGCASLEGG